MPTAFVQASLLVIHTEGENYVTQFRYDSKLLFFQIMSINSNLLYCKLYLLPLENISFSISSKK